MTDSPPRGLSTKPEPGAGAARTAIPRTPTQPEPPRTLLPRPPACAARRRRPGPPAAPRSALRADPGPRRLSRRAQQPGEEDQRTKNTGLTGPAPTGNGLAL